MQDIMTKQRYLKNKFNTKFFQNLCICCVLFSISACASAPSVDIPPELAHEVKDVRNIPQNPIFFLENNQTKDRNALLISAETSVEETKKFRENYFRTWQSVKPMQRNITYFKSILNVSYARRGYAENLQKWTNKHFMLLAQNANYKDAPSMSQDAIITTNTALRAAPTTRPYFYQPQKPGKAYPFDMFQNSSLHIGAPVKIFHVSKDGQWFYVESATAGGWVFAKDLAFVDDAFIENWVKSTHFASIINDEVELISSDLKTLAFMGTILPIVSSADNYFTICVPYRNTKGRVSTDVIKISKQHAMQQPIPFTAANVAKLADHLMGNLYGWGGLYGNRDCSSTLQDLYTAFGIWLPRNSRAQAQVGEVISLANMTNKEKEKEILAKAIPFQTFIFLPGHIGLYVGQYDNQAVMLHNIWGTRLEGNGRFVIGKTVITSLYPGMEHSEAVQSLMCRVQSFNIIAQ